MATTQAEPSVQSLGTFLRQIRNLSLCLKAALEGKAHQAAYVLPPSPVPKLGYFYLQVTDSLNQIGLNYKKNMLSQMT